MTLTELRYLAALAETRHFGRAAEKCHVSQPTLSMGIRSLEDKLGLKLCERRRQETLLTQAGEAIAAEAGLVLERVKAIGDMALASRDEFEAPLRLGVIYTVAPALLPYLVRATRAHQSRLKLHLRENYTDELLVSLRAGTLDAIILSPPFGDEGLDVVPLYSEPFVVAMPKAHPWTRHKRIAPAALSSENVLLLTAGNCFRDQVLDVCPDLRRQQNGASQSFQILEGSSLSTIRQMVASGAGVTILPSTSVAPSEPTHSMLEFRPFSGVTPTRDIVLAARKNFTRPAALDELVKCLRGCDLPGVEWSPPGTGSDGGRRRQTRQAREGRGQRA
jgi:LysR family hydrogen peroxide-inducible transcriptional activator